MTSLSCVAPVYNGSKTLSIFLQELHGVLSALNIQFEIVLVDDGSADLCWELIAELKLQFPEIVGVKLSRNFGQHMAITAGIAVATGDYIVVMDSDGQDDPNYIQDFLSLAYDKVDIVFAVKESRKHSYWKNLGGLFFAKLFNLLVGGGEASEAIGNYSLISRRVADEFRKFTEKKRHYVLILKSLGFKSSKILVKHRPRLQGESGYSIMKLVKHGVHGIVYYSDSLLKLSAYLGGLFFLVGVLFLSRLAWLWFNDGVLEGFTSVVAILFGGFGILMMMMGVIGLYLSAVFEEVKGRELFIVEDRC